MRDRRMIRKVMVAGLLASMLGLAGCESFDMDKLDVFGLNEKKKLPGERKPVFPEGVPGVSQGVPPELMMGHTQQPEPDQAALPAPPAPEARRAEKPAAAPAAAPRAARPRVANRPTRIPAQQSQPARQDTGQGASSPWPSGNQPSNQPSSNQQPDGTAQPAWPAPPPAGRFQ